MKKYTSWSQHLCICMHIRGVARLDPRVARAANALLEAGFRLYIVDIESKSTAPVEENRYGISMRHMLRPQWLQPTKFPVRLFRSLEKFCYSVFYLVQAPADIYHAHNDNALLPCFIAALLRNKPLIFEAHEMPLYVLEHVNWLVATAITLVFRAIIQRCAAVIVVSPPIVREVQKRYNVLNVALVRNTPPYRRVAKSNRLRMHFGLDAATRIVLYQGNIQPDRCLDKLVRATKLLSPNIVVVLMGKHVGTTSAELVALAQEEGCSAQLKILPPVPQNELLEWTASADIGVIMSSPSYSMNTHVFLPNKLFEYMMAGLPVLSSRLPAVEEILYGHDVGCIFASLEPITIAATIEAMLADTRRLARMRENALRASEQEFCWRREKFSLLRLYHQVLQQHFPSGKNAAILQHLETVPVIQGGHHAHSLYLQH